VEPSGYKRISALGVEEQRVPVIIDITSPYDEWRNLGDGYRVVVEFLIWQGENVLQVPSSALFREKKSWALFTISNGRAHYREVEIDHQSGLWTEIVDGLSEVDLVLTHPDERIEDGTRVTQRP
jgi:HlyD family secretion protein